MNFIKDIREAIRSLHALTRLDSEYDFEKTWQYIGDQVNMSMLSWGVGDILAITKLAWDLYHGCYLVAREAPDGFRQLVNELASLQGVLRTLRDDINSDKSFFERLGESRKQMLEKCLQACFDTLRSLQKLTIKYRELGLGDGIQFWRKLKWTTKQGEIADLKSKIMVHTCNISLCMSSIGKYVVF